MKKIKQKKIKLHIKRGDIVKAISGEDAAGGKTGKVLMVFPKKGMALVEGLNFVKKHMRKSQDNPQGGIIQKEAPLPVCKLKRVKEGEKEESAKVKSDSK